MNKLPELIPDVNDLRARDRFNQSIFLLLSKVGSSSIAPGTINANTVYTTNVTITGAQLGWHAIATPTNTVEAGLVWVAYVSAANTVTLRIANPTGGNIAVTTRTWNFRLIP